MENRWKSRGLKMPETNIKQAMIPENAKKLINAGAQMVKFEGGAEHKESFKILQDNNASFKGYKNA